MRDIEKVLGKICQSEVACIQTGEDSDRQSRNLSALMSMIYYYYPKKKDRRAYYNLTTPVPTWVQICFCRPSHVAETDLNYFFSCV
jgi:hypothetical protein